MGGEPNVVRAFKAPTLTALHDKLCDRLVLADVDELDVISAVDVQMHNVIAHASSMEWNFDLKSMWLTPSRWSMMCNQYIEVDDLSLWLDKIATHIGVDGRGIALMRTKLVKARGGKAQGNKETRRWGSCMIAVSYKAIPRPQITLYSRTSYLGYLGALDLTIAWMCGKYVAEAVGCAVEDFEFVWMNEAMQFHNFKSLAYMLSNPDEKDASWYRDILIPLEEDLSAAQLKVLDETPALRLSRKWFQKLLLEDRRGDSYGVTRYNTYRRIRRRFHTEVMGLEYAERFQGWSYYQAKDKAVKAGQAVVGEQKEWFPAYRPLPHTHVSTLDFGRLGLPLGD